MDMSVDVGRCREMAYRRASTKRTERRRSILYMEGGGCMHLVHSVDEAHGEAALDPIYGR